MGRIRFEKQSHAYQINLPNIYFRLLLKFCVDDECLFKNNESIFLLWQIFGLKDKF